VRDDGLPRLELEALAVQCDLDAVGLEGDEAPIAAMSSNGARYDQAAWPMPSMS
jgi:hypothetical protein